MFRRLSQGLARIDLKIQIGLKKTLNTFDVPMKKYLPVLPINELIFLVYRTSNIFNLVSYTVNNYRILVQSSINSTCFKSVYEKKTSIK
jgi:hypothetical protein